MNYVDENNVFLRVVYKRDEEGKKLWEILKSMHPDNRLTHEEWLEKINQIMDLANHLQHLSFVEGVLTRPQYGKELGVWVDLNDYLYVQNGEYVRLE